MLIVLAGPAGAEPVDAWLRVAGMTCETSCAVRVERVLREQPEVLDVVVEYAEARVRVTFQPEVTSAEILARALERDTEGRFLARPEARGEEE